MFKGQATVKPKCENARPFSVNGTWLYRPDTDCWYVNGMSFSKDIVEYFIED
jgi:hypothetical protein